MSFSYTGSYFLGFFEPADVANTSYPLPATEGTWTFTDDLDGDEDGIIANGATFSYEVALTSDPSNVFQTGTATFLGTTANGDPYLLVKPTGAFNDFYYILSNELDLWVDGPNLIGPINTTTPLCFLSGTRILTPLGEVAVEDLRIGDTVTTQDGRNVPVTWIGRQTVSTRFNPAERLRPVRVAADALGPNLPFRDLRLTPDHALLIDGLLINAGALVNGTTITHMPLPQFDGSYTVYHVETADHNIIISEGCSAETYIDYVGRQSFDNFAEYLALYGEERTIMEMPTPRISSPRQLPPALAARLGITRAA